MKEQCWPWLHRWSEWSHFGVISKYRQCSRCKKEQVK